MRRSIFESSRSRAVGVLEAAEVVHLATSRPDGRPILRTLHPALVDDFIVFHGATVGEKAAVIGREAVVSAESIVASIPSYFSDPERACPATTLYESVQVAGIIEAVADLEFKTRALAALMDRFQPEGGFVPLDHQDPIYRKSIEEILIFRLSLDALVGKAKLGQNIKPSRRRTLLERLWRRGDVGDCRAIEQVLQANPDTPLPAFLEAPGRARMLSFISPRRADEAVALVTHEYWNRETPPSVTARAHRHSLAWVGAEDAAGRLIATARAIGDSAKLAYIADVAVDREWRGQGVGAALMRLLLDHPAVRGAQTVWLQTQDAQSFYERFGFVGEPQVVGDIGRLRLQRRL